MVGWQTYVKPNLTLTYGLTVVRREPEARPFHVAVADLIKDHDRHHDARPVAAPGELPALAASHLRAAPADPAPPSDHEDN